MQQPEQRPEQREGKLAGGDGSGSAALEEIRSSIGLLIRQQQSIEDKLHYLLKHGSAQGGHAKG